MILLNNSLTLLKSVSIGTNILNEITLLLLAYLIQIVYIHLCNYPFYRL